MTNPIRTESLDFAEIKQNLKTFLSAQPTLLDYDFDGSIISNLIDVLAFNTHYNALYTNMAIKEMFLDSASKRSSVASIAKLLGYVPKSVSSSKAIVRVEATKVTGTPDATLILPRGSTFTVQLDGTSYVFNLLEDKITAKDNAANLYVFPSVTIHEGELATITYIHGAKTKLIIPETKADTDTLKVSVTAQNITKVYTAATSIVDVGYFDDVFFLKYRDDGFYEIYFGDGTFGTVVADGSIVTMSYIVCNGANANLASSFTYAAGGDSNYQYTVNTTSASSGGAAEEDKEAIRFFAPMTHQAQSRAVTANDYVAILAESYPNIETVSVWGGQDNIPPKYGKVFIAAKPYGKDAFTANEKYDLARGIIKNRGVVTVSPEFVDPKYFDVELTSSIYYNPNKTTLAPGAIQTNALAAIETYANSLSKFDTAFRHSVITGKLAAVDPSIVSTISTIRVRNVLTPYLGVSTNYSTNFGNPIVTASDATFISSRFFLDGYPNRGYLSNVGTDIVFFTEDAGGIPTYQIVVGSLNFAGSVILQNLQIQSLYDNLFEFVFYPASYDVIPPNGVIVKLPLKYVKINMIIDSLSQSRNAKSDYTFSASR